MAKLVKVSEELKEQKTQTGVLQKKVEETEKSLSTTLDEVRTKATQI